MTDITFFLWSCYFKYFQEDSHIFRFDTFVLSRNYPLDEGSYSFHKPIFSRITFLEYFCVFLEILVMVTLFDSLYFEIIVAVF